MNPEFALVFGYTLKEAIGRELCELIAPGELEQSFRTKQELASNGERSKAETIRQRKDGARLDVLVVSVPVSLPNRRIEVWVIYHDVTARKKAEVALRAISKRLLEVQEAERRHLAGELHDEIGQQLTGLRLLLRVSGEVSVDAIRSRFDQARDIVDGLLKTVRRLSFDLRPADLDQFGLLPALLGLFERYTIQTGVQVDFKHLGIDRRFGGRAETAAYRIVQEALTNTARHAGVPEVSVRMWTEGDRLNLQIDDRGRGFDPDAVMKVARSTGLFGMSERTTLVGGRMTIESNPGSGTTISAELPFYE